MLNGRYQIRAKPPSHGVKRNNIKETNRTHKLYYAQDGQVYVLGMLQTLEQFVGFYVNQRKQQVVISEDIEARTLRLSQQSLDRLSLLLSLAHNRTIESLSDTTATFFYDPIKVITDESQWQKWKEEYEVE